MTHRYQHLADKSYDIVHLTADEYDPTFWTDHRMAKVAKEHFAAHPDCQFGEANEPGCWRLGHRRDGSIWSTANDAAKITGPRPTMFSGIEVRR